MQPEYGTLDAMHMHLYNSYLSSLASSIFPTQLSFQLKAKSMYNTSWTKIKMNPPMRPNTYQTVVNGANCFIN